MTNTIGVIVTAIGAFLIYEALAPRGKLSNARPPSYATPGPLDPGMPPVAGIPKSILPKGYAECIAEGGKWDTGRGVCVWTS